MLSDGRYRAWVVRQVKDPMVRSFWVDEFERASTSLRQEMVAPVQNKVGQLLMSPHLRNILGQIRSRIDARFMMDNGRIFIADVSKGKLGADKANLLGSLLVTQFELAAMSRSNVPESERRDFYLYVDEFQSFATDSFISILSEARKYHLCLTLSHQYTDQLRPEIRDAVFGNVGSIVAFRVGQRDAEMLENEFGGEYPARQIRGFAEPRNLRQDFERRRAWRFVHGENTAAVGRAAQSQREDRPPVAGKIRHASEQSLKTESEVGVANEHTTVSTTGSAAGI